MAPFTHSTQKPDIMWPKFSKHFVYLTHHKNHNASLVHKAYLREHWSLEMSGHLLKSIRILIWIYGMGSFDLWPPHIHMHTNYTYKQWNWDPVSWFLW